MLQVNVDDVWSWAPDPAVGYTVRGAYRTLTDETIVIHTAPAVPAALLWRKHVPLKVSIFGWCLFRNRLPTKVNLFRMRIIQHDAQLCVTGYGMIKSDVHLFSSCSVFGQVWHLARQWLGVHSSDPATIVDHFTQFGTSSGFAKSRCSIMCLIWFASSWVIQKEMNARIFRVKESTPIQLLKNIKLLSFWWYKTQFVVYYYKFYDWCPNPFLCLV